VKVGTPPLRAGVLSPLQEMEKLAGKVVMVGATTSTMVTFWVVELELPQLSTAEKVRMKPPAQVFP